MASDSGYKPIPDSEAFGPVPTQTPAAKPKSRGRRFGVAAALTFLVLLLFRDPLVHCCQQISEHVNHKHKTVEQRAHHVLSRHPLIDGHIDLPIALRFSVGNRIDNAEFTKSFAEGGLMGHVDLHRLRKGLSGGAFWSVFAPCPEDGSDFSDGNYAASVQYTLDQIDVMKRLQSAFPHDFSKSYESAAALSDFHRHGKLISPLGVEGLHQIANSAANLRRFHDLGVRYATLTHNCHNKFADAAIVGEPPRKSEPHWGGVSPIGRQLVHEMNRIGMIIDLSHVR
jgi:membrane dipeptidase